MDDLEVFDKELKGELTIVISEKKIDKNHSQKLSVKEITDFISQSRKISKKKIYNYCLKLKNEN